MDSYRDDFKMQSVIGIIKKGIEEGKIEEVDIELGDGRISYKNIGRKAVVRGVPRESKWYGELLDIQQKAEIDTSMRRKISEAKNAKYDKLLEGFYRPEYNNVKYTNDDLDRLADEYDIYQKRKTNQNPNRIKNRRFTFKKKIVEMIENTQEKTKKRLAVGLVGLVAVGGIITTHCALENYKSETAIDILETVKEELDAKEIWDKSTKLSSNSEEIKYVVIRDDGTFGYSAYYNDGDLMSEQNDGLTKETRMAIKAAAAAQDGNIIDAMKAAKIAKGIKRGEIELNINGKNTNEYEYEYEK